MLVANACPCSSGGRNHSTLPCPMMYAGTPASILPALINAYFDEILFPMCTMIRHAKDNATACQPAKRNDAGIERCKAMFAGAKSKVVGSTMSDIMNQQP